VTGGDLSTSERALIYAATLDAVRQHPLLGVGLDGLVVVYPSVRPPGTSAISGTNVTQSSTHSWFLQQLLGAGAAGALVSLSLVLATFGAAWSLARSGRPAAVIGLAGLAAFLAQGAFNIVHVVTDTFFWLSIGLSAAASAGDQGNASQVRSHRTMLLAGLAAVVGLAAAATVWSSLEANRAVRASNVARVDRDLATAERHAVRATELDPGRADHWNVLGLARTGRPEAAIQAFRRAVEAASYEPVYLLNLAREEARASERTPALKTSAREHAARAVQLDPNSSRTHFAYSQTLALIGDLDAAAAPAERAIVLEPSPDNYDWAALIYADLGRPLDAIARLRSKQALLFPDGKLPLDERLRLGRLHEAVGDIGSARALFAPPTAAGADPNCEPTFGSARLGASLVRPRCIRLVFEIEAPLLADRTTPGTVTDPAAYTIGDEALPRGSTIFYDGRRFVTVQLPADALPPEPRTQIVVRGITDIFGNRITPDPGHLAMQ
jgi:tetratricopeptide (TPR) repeat protein